VLGVMHLATEIAKRLQDEEQYFEDDKDNRLRTTLRFAALLHDMGHVPFGHTLEDEMPIILKHDLPSTKSAAPVTPSRMEATVSEVLGLSGNSEFIKPVMQVLLAISKSKDDAELYRSVQAGDISPELLVLADIIGNTICADLLDYIKRDHMMAGIRATYDDRIFRYFGVGQHEFQGKYYPRLLIKLVRNGRVRGDCLADLLDILKLRFNLSDKVLFHPKKCAADAMLIRAVGDLNLSEHDLMRFSDDGLLDAHRDDKLIALLRRQDLFKPVFVCKLEHINSYDEKHRKNDLIERLHRDRELRLKIERAIQTDLGDEGSRPSALIFCPRPDMTLKPVRVLVRWKDGTIRRLNDIKAQDDPITHKQVSVLEEIYPDLWKLYLLVPRELRSRGRQIRQKFGDLLKEELGLVAACDPAFENYLEKSVDYRMGVLLDSELELTEAYGGLSRDRKAKARAACHAKLPANDFDEDYADVQTVASRTDEPALKERLRALIAEVLETA
jgi:HD superfamily phosphohydrolase